METVAETDSPKLSGLDLVRLSRGFSCVFWGLPGAMLFCIQLLIMTVVVADPFGRASLMQLYFFLFCAMLGVVSIGSYFLLRAEGPGVHWRLRARLNLCCALLSLYFSPFLYWWQAFPHETFYTLNLFGLILSVVALLASLNNLCAELGRVIGEPSLRRESKLFLGLILVLIGLPAASAFVWAAIRSLKAGTSEALGLEFLRLFQFSPHLRLTLFILLFLPAALTLANIWRVKEMLLDELKKLPGG